MTKRMIDPKPYIALVDALNALEPIVKQRDHMGIHFAEGIAGGELEFGGHYSVQWDSEAARWTLISETDDAPTLCSFNQDTVECREIDLCQQCQEVADMLEDLN